MLNRSPSAARGITRWRRNRCKDIVVLTFAVHEAPIPPADRVERAANLLFVKDAFTWPAALFTPLWLIVHRLWWPLLGYLALVALLLESASALALDPGWIVLGLAALNLLVGLEAAPLRMWSLVRRGFSDLGSVTGRTLPECERRFIEAWLPAQPIIAPGVDERNHADRWWRLRPLSMRV
jgi:Protein of unknown function (DUF2628)